MIYDVFDLVLRVKQYFEGAYLVFEKLYLKMIMPELVA